VRKYFYKGVMGGLK